jgi:hypothetical protein
MPAHLTRASHRMAIEAERMASIEAAVLPSNSDLLCKQEFRNTGPVALACASTASIAKRGNGLSQERRQVWVGGVPGEPRFDSGDTAMIAGATSSASMSWSAYRV